MVAVAVSVPYGLAHLNWVDFVFLVVLVYSVLSGAWIGFFAECVSLAGVAAGTFVAGLTYSNVGSMLNHAGVPAKAQDWAGFVAVFVVVSFIFRFFSVKSRRLSKVLVVGISNELAGAMLGLIVGAIICLFAIVTVAYFNVGSFVDPLHQSQIALHTKNLVEEYVTMLPMKMHMVPGFVQ
jgi:uncharacterized membrane protein required for colicin V production